MKTFFRSKFGWHLEILAFLKSSELWIGGLLSGRKVGEGEGFGGYSGKNRLEIFNSESKEFLPSLPSLFKVNFTIF
jgi:hypothetical protein